MSSLHLEHLGKKYAFEKTDIGEIVHMIETVPQVKILGCRRCKVVCFHRPLACKCCMNYRKSKAYPDDGKGHLAIYEADAFLERLTQYAQRRAA